VRTHVWRTGFPIANDQIYNNPAWGSGRGVGGVARSDTVRILEELVSAGVFEHETLDTDGGRTAGSAAAQARDEADGAEPECDALAMRKQIDPICPDCQCVLVRIVCVQLR
jgi:hypothetical protein